MPMLDDIRRLVGSVIGDTSEFNIRSDNEDVLIAFRYAKVDLVWSMADKLRNAMRAALIERFSLEEREIGYKATIASHEAFSVQYQIRKEKELIDRDLLIAALIKRGWGYKEVMDLVEESTSKSKKQVFISSALSDS